MSSRETLDDDVSTLLRLHRLRWGDGAPFAESKGRSWSAASLAAPWSAAGCGWLRLAVLELDGRPAAADLGLRFAGAHASWQAGWDPEYEQYSVGSVLTMQALQAAVEDGMSEYRLLRGDDAYKQRLANVDRPTRTVAFAEGWLSNSLIGLACARRRTEQQGLPALGEAAGALKHTSPA